jgi:Flp pilus assembly protein TadD/ketosteroid isomerase-like protein
MSFLLNSMNYNIMLNLNLRRRALATVAFAVSSALGSLAYAGPAEDMKEATKLYQQSKLDAALSKVNAALAQAPKDAQGRFLKGLILTEQKKYNEAIQTFTGLTEDYPELPEPYNNLAVLYASQGNYDKAKAALELAIHTHPSYATAHENLGDIYAQLARRAYDKALQLDKSNAAAQSKLAMVKDIFAPPKSAIAAVAKAEPVRSTPATPQPTVVAAAPTAAPPSAPAAAPAKSAPPTPPPVTVAAANPSTTAAPKAPTAAPAAAPVTAPVAAPVAAPPAATAAATSNAEAQISSVIRDWAAAWSRKDVASYLSFYAPDFETPDKLARNTWEQQRTQRIQAPSFIKVDVQIGKVAVSGNEATVVFRQRYKSDKLSSDNSKTLKLAKVGDRWMIRAERTGT